MTLADPAPWLLLVAAAHLGFQATVTLLVYPALAEVPIDGWSRSHALHSRRIVPLVAVLYLPLVALLGWAAASHPGEVGAWLAVVGGVLSLGTTAAVAAPAHGQLSTVAAAGRPVLMRRLTRADRLRTIGAMVCVAGAVSLLA